MTENADYHNEETIAESSEVFWEKLLNNTDIAGIIEDAGAIIINDKELESIEHDIIHRISDIKSEENRPEVFKINGLNVLPLGNDEYTLIGNFQTFQNIDYQQAEQNRYKTRIEFESDISEIKNMVQEHEVVLNAYNNNIIQCYSSLEDDLRLIGYEKKCMIPLDFNINILKKKKTFNVKVSNQQIKTDAIFESLDSIIITVAKIGLNYDFNIKELYFPFRAIAEKTNKEIKCIYLTTSAGSIYTHVYRFRDKMNYNSIELVECARHELFEPISLSEVKEILNKTDIINEPPIMFPQANSIDRLFQVLEIVKNNSNNTAKTIAQEMGLAERQGNYYGTACIYLDLLKRNKVDGTYHYRLTNYAIEMMSKPWKERNLMMIQAIVRHHVFYHFVEKYLKTLEQPTKEEITDWLINNAEGLEDRNQTPTRRSSTVLGWVNWIIQITGYE